MIIHFEKYQGTGNDFVMLDNMSGQYDALSIEHIRQLCDRRFGIGADGLIKINRHPNYDFEVDYYNSDGSKSFCGNGARCAVKFAGTLGLTVSECRFLGIDGEHKAAVKKGLIYLDMLPVGTVERYQDAFVLHTGSPHFVKFSNNLSAENIGEYGKAIRYSDQFKKEGINVNLVKQLSRDSIQIETYERGVEDETLSCGTGATACALVLATLENRIGDYEINVAVKGGDLKVAYSYLGNNSFKNIQLIGPAECVFKGTMNV
jgi:diaminopimelate epimerase